MDSLQGLLQGTSSDTGFYPPFVRTLCTSLSPSKLVARSLHIARHQVTPCVWLSPWSPCTYSRFCLWHGSDHLGEWGTCHKNPGRVHPQHSSGRDFQNILEDRRQVKRGRMFLFLNRIFCLGGCGPQWTQPLRCLSCHSARGTPPYLFAVSLNSCKVWMFYILCISDHFMWWSLTTGQYENMPVICSVRCCLASYIIYMLQ